MAKDNSRVTKRARSEAYPQRRTSKFTKTSAIDKNTNFSKFSPPSLIFSPFHFIELQMFIKAKFGITTITSKPEIKLTAHYQPQERNSIKERHRIEGNFAVVSFDNFEDRDVAFEAAKQGSWNVQIFTHRGQRRAVSATARPGLENFLKRVSGPKAPNSSSSSNSANTNTNTTPDGDIEMKEAPSNARANYNRRRNARSTEHQNSKTNANSQLGQDVNMEDSEPIQPNINNTPFATTATPEAYDGDIEMSDSQDSDESQDVEMEGYNSTPFTTPPTTPPVAFANPAAFHPLAQFAEEMEMDDLSAQLASWDQADKMEVDVDDLSAALSSSSIYDKRRGEGL